MFAITLHPLAEIAWYPSLTRRDRRIAIDFFEFSIRELLELKAQA